MIAELKRYFLSNIASTIAVNGKAIRFSMLTFFFTFYPASSYALSLDSSDIILNCPVRGKIEVILHRYEHTQESWGKDNFETGGGYAHQGNYLMFPFANLDQLIYNKKSGKLLYWYADKHDLVSCEILNITSTRPVDVPLYHEKLSLVHDESRSKAR